MTVRPPSKFVSLHSHTHFSVGDGLGYPAEHMDFCLENGLDGWALTDHGNGNGLAHAASHQQKLAKKGKDFRFIHGVEFYFVPDLRQWSLDREASRQAARLARSKEEADDLLVDDVDSEQVVKAAAPGDDDDEQGGHVIEDEDETKSQAPVDESSNWKRRYHLVVLARSSAGLQNLYTLVKRSFKEGYYRFPRIDFRMLKEHGEGLIVSTACVHPDEILQTSAGQMRMEDVVYYFQRNKEPLFVLSWNESEARVEFKEITWGDLTRRKAKLLKIKLVNGKTIRVTPDHKIFTDQGWKRADELTTDMRILTLQNK